MAFNFTLTFFVVVSLALASSRSANRIVGGEEAGEHEFPYQISLQWNFNEDGKEIMHFCGGSLLNEYYVLTAAHCRTGYSDNGHIEVVAADHDVSSRDGSEQRRLVAEFTIHEAYDNAFGGNDIAVIRVDKPFVLNDKVQTIQLPKQFDQFDGDVVLSGWGSVSNTIVPEYPDKLRKVVLPLVDMDMCLKLWNYESSLKETNVCAGPVDGSKSACSADSGGPLVKHLDGQVVQVGIVSWGAVPCGAWYRPTVFVGVSNFIDWIEYKVRQ